MSIWVTTNNHCFGLSGHCLQLLVKFVFFQLGESLLWCVGRYDRCYLFCIWACRLFGLSPVYPFKVAVCGQYLGYDRSNEGPLVFLHFYFVCIKIDASLICICKTIIVGLTGTVSTPGLHFFVTKPHLSPNRNSITAQC